MKHNQRVVDIARSQNIDPSQLRRWIRQYKAEITGVTLLFCDITDVSRFVNERCQFLPAMKPLQLRYAKKYADADSLLTVIVAKAMNHGNHVMARTCDIPFHVLETTYEQCLRLASLLTANCITDAIKVLSIFPLYSFDPETLYGTVDGQKFGIELPTVKTRHSRKYFSHGKGMVASPLRSVWR